MAAAAPSVFHWMKKGIYRWVRHRNVRRMEEFEVLFRWLDPRPGERILDVGCGDGLYDREIARSDARVIGVDIDTNRLDDARLWHDDPGTEYHLMNAERLGFEDCSFDKAVSFCVIEHFSNDGRVLEQIHRVLKPGAPLVFSADSLSNMELTEKERSVHSDSYCVNSFYNVRAIRKKLADAGFRLEVARYILTSHPTLLIVRLSWWLDRLPRAFTWLKWLGYIVLGTAGKRIVDLSDRIAGRHDSGLTLLVLARRQ